MIEQAETLQPPVRRRYYHPIQHEYATFLATSGETGGELTRIEFELPPGPGGGPAPHSHMAHEEHFEVLQGSLEIRAGDTVRVLHAGEQATVAKGQVHAFTNPTHEPVRFLVEVRPGHAGFERGLLVAFGIARDGLATRKGLPKSPLHLAVVLDWAQARLPGAMRLVEPMFRMLARRARRLGIDRELEQRYVDIPSARSRPAG